LQICSSSISQNNWQSGKIFHSFNGLLYVAVKNIFTVFFDEYELIISLDKSVQPVKCDSSNAIISKFNFLIFFIVSLFIYFCISCFEIINILFLPIVISFINLEQFILWIVKILKSLNLKNNSSVNCDIIQLVLV